MDEFHKTIGYMFLRFCMNILMWGSIIIALSPIILIIDFIIEILQVTKGE